MGEPVAALLCRAAELVSDSPRLDVELLLAHVLGRGRAFLRAWPEAELSAEQRALFEALFLRRQRGEPMAYILGYAHFWSLRLRVEPCALIPRPETELLVECALELAPRGGLKVLDMGTGTGAVALALASECADWSIDAIDIDERCVALATVNAAAHQLTKVRCWQSDWFAQVAGRYGLIVANPPYIRSGDSHLRQGDLRFEPQLALASGPAGMGAIERIAVGAARHLEPGAWLMLEHGYDQGASCQQLLSRLGFYQVQCRRDLAGRDRVTLGRLSS